jgi:hypothetical protein
MVVRNRSQLCYHRRKVRTQFDVEKTVFARHEATGSMSGFWRDRITRQQESRLLEEELDRGARTSRELCRHR